MCEVMRVKEGEIKKILKNENLKFDAIKMKKAVVSTNIKPTVAKKINKCIKSL